MVLPVSSTKTGVFEDEMGIWTVSSTKLRDFEDEVIDRTQKRPDAKERRASWF